MLTAAERLKVGDDLFISAVTFRRRQLGRPILVGVCGPQGSGKSTTALRLANGLESRSLRTAVCSLDDFYLTRGERATLARDVHPLFVTRGVPGTHDLSLMKSTLEALSTSQQGDIVQLPQFDKATDDRVEPGNWRAFVGPVDVIILEGWCVGARAEDKCALMEPANALEAERDQNKIWRRYVNERLETDYAQVFDRLDLRLMLRPPSFEQIYEWRMEQETTIRRNAQSLIPMNGVALKYFISHYERVTRWLLADEPADLVADLDEFRIPVTWRIPRNVLAPQPRSQ